VPRQSFFIVAPDINSFRLQCGMTTQPPTPRQRFFSFFIPVFFCFLVGERGLSVGRGGAERKSPAGELIEICPHQQQHHQQHGLKI